MEHALTVRRQLAHGEMEVVERKSLVEVGRIPLAGVEGVRVQMVAEEVPRQQVVVEGVRRMLVVQRMVEARQTLAVAVVLPCSPRRHM
jgi:hypothetical protein